MDGVEKLMLDHINPIRAGYGCWIGETVIFTKNEQIELGDHVRIDDFVKIEGGRGVELESYIHIASFAHLNIGGGILFMGEHSCVASGGKIITGGNRPNGRSMSASSPKDLQIIDHSVVIVEPYAAVLTNAVVLPGSILSEGSRLAAGAVLNGKIPPFEIWGGIPAKKIGEVPR